MPCNVLGGFKLAHRVVNSLPRSILRRMYSNCHSPILPVRVASRKKGVVRKHAHFTLIEARAERTSVLFCPILTRDQLRRFDRTGYRGLRTKGTIVTAVASTSNERIRTFRRVSRNAKRVLSIPAPIVNHGLRCFYSCFRLDGTRLGYLRGNRPLALISRNDVLALNVSLRSPANVHVNVKSRHR